MTGYSDLSVGDEIIQSNPNKEGETYALTICGIYETEETGDSVSEMMGGFMAGADSTTGITTTTAISSM